VILIDTNVLVGLMLVTNSHHHRALEDLERLERQAFYLTLPVLTEISYHLSAQFLRTRLFSLINRLKITLYPREHEVPLERTFDWLMKYADHEPDFTDAHLIQISQLDRKVKIWTYDNEFHTIWRRLDGSRVPMATRLA
jgi:predicted nucleic acid-binding protein